ncbi:pyridoxal-phosphate dependent enzyme [Streptomyces albidoflavus]|uniref:pyridoxal-phosphate dependent enzyme n=1 Tax=Streptomyces albidoflavus TaxID=1886 RepID=UPI00365B7EFE
MTGHPSRPATLAEAPAVGGTPVRPVRVPLPGRSVRLWLKLEAENSFGSVKARTAAALLDRLEETGRLGPGRRVVESTSGNLGVALAGLCRARGYACSLVVEESTPRSSVDRMVAYGAEVLTVRPAPGTTTLDARLAAVRDLLARDPDAVWTDQYASTANPRVHETRTAVELAAAAPGGGFDAVCVAVSTGGTLAGVATHFRRHAPATSVVAVDAVGSAALGGVLAERPYKLSGFGSGRRSRFVEPRHWDAVVRLRDEDAAAACARVLVRGGVSLGGSAGAAVLAAVLRAGADPALREVACLCPDGGEKYPQIDPAHAGSRPAGAAPAIADALDLLSLLTPEGG